MWYEHWPKAKGSKRKRIRNPTKSKAKATKAPPPFQAKLYSKEIIRRYEDSRTGIHRQGYHTSKLIVKLFRQSMTTVKCKTLQPNGNDYINLQYIFLEWSYKVMHIYIIEKTHVTYFYWTLNLTFWYFWIRNKFKNCKNKLM